MSRDAWSKKRANASDDNGWAEMVSICPVIIINHVWQMLPQYEEVPTLKRKTVGYKARVLHGLCIVSFTMLLGNWK